MIAARTIYAMLDNENLWELAERYAQILADAQIPCSVCGGVAVCLHGYQRNTVDLNLVVRSDDSDRIQSLLEGAGMTWNATTKEFRTESGIARQFLIAGVSVCESCLPGEYCGK